MPSYGPASSPKYNELKQLVEDHREELENETLTRYGFYTKYAVPLDPNINVGPFMGWLAQKIKPAKALVEDLIEKHFLEDYKKKTPEEKMEAVDKMQSEIRYFAKKLFHAKIYEFIDNPASANKLKFSELQKLYKMIREEESREKEIAIKQQDTKRKDIFGLFAIMSLAKQFPPEELEKIKQLVMTRKDGQDRLQQSSESGDSGSAEGPAGDVLPTVGSSIVGEV